MALNATTLWRTTSVVWRGRNVFNQQHLDTGLIKLRG
jgi:hypothetical protein